MAILLANVLFITATFQIPSRYARPPFHKGAFGSPPLSKEGQGGFRQQYRLACALQKFFLLVQATENRSRAVNFICLTTLVDTPLKDSFLLAF